MIINGQSDKQVSIVGGESKIATINPEEVTKLQYLLTKGLYSDPIGAVIVEWTNNAVDSVVQSGKDPIENPVIVEIGYTSQGGHFLRVSDKGTGLDKETFENVCMNYLTSTKTHSNDYIGSFGIGMKSFLSLDRNVIFTCRKDGIECKYNVYQGNNFVEYDLLHEGPTTEENGVICELPINNWQEYIKFQEKAKKKLAYYDTVLLFLDNADEPVENVISRTDLFQWSSLVSKSVPMHMSLKDVYYEIDFTKLDIPTIYFPVCLRFSLEDGISPTPSREGVIYNEQTKKLILQRIKDVADFFVTLYNNQYPEVDPETDPQKALTYVSNSTNKDKTVNFEDRSWQINSLLEHSSFDCEGYKLKGVTLRSLKFYKERLGAFRLGVDSFKYINPFGKIGRSKPYFSPIAELLKGTKVILVDSVYCKDKLSRFLFRKHSKGKDIFLVTKNDDKLPLRRKGLYSNRSYYDLLELSKVPRANWRKTIQEWQYIDSCISKLIIDESQAHLSQEYLDYKKETTEKASSNYQRLNKQQGDITIHYHDPASARKDKLSSKKTLEISRLHANKCLFVIVSEEQEELAAKLQRALKLQKILFVKIGPRDLKKLPKVHNFIKMDEFINKSKPFKRIATALRIRKTLGTLSTDMMYNVNQISKQKGEVLHELEKYLRNNSVSIYTLGDEAMLDESIVEVANKFDLWDEEIIHKVKEFEQFIEDCSFIKLFNIKLSDSSLLGPEIKRVFHQLMLFRKVYRKQFENFELVEKVVEVEEVSSVDSQPASAETLTMDELAHVANAD